MGVLLKLLTWPLATALTGFLAWFTYMVVTIRSDVSGWGLIRVGLVLGVLVYVAVWARFTYRLIRERCPRCGSRNTWRNILPKDTGPDSSYTEITHFYRLTKCYSCKEEWSHVSWTAATNDILGGLLGPR